MLCILLLTGTAGCSGTGEIRETIEQTVKEVIKKEFPEKKISKEEAAFYYGYSSLEEEERKVYRQIVKGVEEFAEEIEISPVSEEQLEAIANMVMVDHPDYFWTEGAFEYSQKSRVDGSVAELKIRPVYLLSKEEAEAMQPQIEAKAQEWIAGISQDADTYEKIKYVYETLIREVNYDENNEQNQNIRSVFLEGSTVCMGYAKATQYLLNKMGVFCTLVTGDIIKPEYIGSAGTTRHAWNLVKIGEEYYYVDTTWGSPGYLGNENSENIGMDIYYSYLCCNETTLAFTHKADDSIPLPACTDDSYNYYKQKGCWYETYDRNQIYHVIQEAIRSKSSMTEFRFASLEAYQQAVTDIAEGTLIKEVVQNADFLPAGEMVSWNIYYRESDCHLAVIWN